MCCRDVGRLDRLAGHDINSALLPFEISFGQILELRDAGMLIAGDQLQKKFDVRDAVANQSKPQVLVNNGTLIELSSAAAPSINVPALIFTRAGRELQRLNDATPNDEYLRALGLHLRSLGFVAKRGMHTAMENGQSLITFETDL